MIQCGFSLSMIMCTYYCVYFVPCCSIILLRSIVIESFCHFGTFHCNRVISLPFLFFTLFSLYSTHLTQIFLIFVPKKNASITMERMEYQIKHQCVNPYNSMLRLIT